MGAEAKAAVPALVEALRDSDAKVRYRSLMALGNLWSGAERGPEVRAAVPALIKLLKDEDEYIRRRAVYVLGRIGPEARAAVPALTEALRDENEDVRSYVAKALGAINSANGRSSSLRGLRCVWLWKIAAPAVV